MKTYRFESKDKTNLYYWDADGNTASEAFTMFADHIKQTLKRFGYVSSPVGRGGCPKTVITTDQGQFAVVTGFAGIKI